MTSQPLQQLEELNRLLLQMASQSEEMLEKSLDALLSQNVTRAKVVAARDNEVDALELTVDAHIFNLLTQHRLDAESLRLILSAQKINNDLKRVADHAVNIAEAAVALSDAPHITTLVIIPHMSAIARSMLKEAIDSFVYRDSTLAHDVIHRDDEVDALYLSAKEKLESLVQENPVNVHTGHCTCSPSRRIWSG